MSGTCSRRLGLKPTRAVAAFAMAVVTGFMIAGYFAPPALAAEARDSGVDMYGRKSFRKTWAEVNKDQVNTFVAVAIGAAIGLLGMSLLHLLWGRSPTAARVVAPIALAIVTARFLGLYLIHERLSAQPMGALSILFFMAIGIPLVYRERIIVAVRKSLPWLRVGARSRRKKPAKTERPKRSAAETAEVAEAERVVSEAIDALDVGDIPAAETALRLSIEIRPSKRARTYLGTLLGARGDGEEALAELERALALDPSYSEALDERRHVLRLLGREDALAEARGEAETSDSGTPIAPTFCPACDSDVEPGAATCACGIVLNKCARCGREDVQLRAHENELVCSPCRIRGAAGHSKGQRRLDGAKTAEGPPPWLAAAAFAGAVVVGAVLSFGYVGLREFRASRALVAIVEDAEAALAAAPGVVAQSELLESRRKRVAARDGFVGGRAAMLKLALGIHGLAQAEELTAAEPELARVAREWAARRLTEARNSLQAGDREELSEGFNKAFKSVAGSLQRLIETRRWLAEDLKNQAAAAVQPKANAASDVERDWRKIWKLPEPGTRFFIECFRRAARDGKAEVVGKHRDGSSLVAVELYACEVVQSEEEGGFTLAMKPVPFRVEKLEGNPGPYPPALRLVRRSAFAGYLGRGAYRLKFGTNREFLALLNDDVKEPATREVTRANLFGSGKLPDPHLPLFAPGIDESWEQDAKLLWLYPGAEPTRGPCVQQLAHWRLDDDGTGARIGIRWRLRYMTLSRRSTQAITQNWTAGRPWWNIYDDGEFFFRTRFDVELEKEE